MFVLTGFGQKINWETDRYWVDAGVGFYQSPNHNSGFAINLGVNLISDSTLYKFRAITCEEFELFGPTPTERYLSMGLMLGKGFSTKFLQIYFSAGLGITGGIIRGDYLYSEPSEGFFDLGGRHYEKNNFVSPSLPLEVDIMLKPINTMGIGLSAFGDLNLKRPMYGFVAKFNFGKLR